MATQPNVVLVVMDTTRADEAFDSTVAPTLADISQEGTRVTEAISAAPWTLPSHASLLTGTHPSKHGAHAGHERLDGALPTLPEIFQDVGYETVCVSNNTWLSIESGFDRGFDSFQQMWQLVQSTNALSELVDVTDEHRYRAVARKLLDGNPVANTLNVLYRRFVREYSDDGAKRTTKWINRWIAERDDNQPFFLLVNYLEPHLEYSPPRRLATQYLPDSHTYGEAMEIPQQPWEYLVGNVTLDDDDFEVLRGLYRAEIAYLDEQLAKLRTTLVEAGEWEDTVIVIMADHGENIGDHGLMDHQYCLYDSLIHVPLVIHGDIFSSGSDLTEPVSTVDLAPTLLDVVDIDAPQAREEFQGRSFHPHADAPPREFVVSEYMSPQPSMDALERHVGELPDHIYELDRSLRAIRTTGHKLIRGSDGTTELYDLTMDPGETADIASENPDLLDELSGALDEWLNTFEQADIDREISIDEARKKQLEELGYIR